MSEEKNRSYVLGGYSGINAGNDAFFDIGVGYNTDQIGKIKDPEGGEKTEMPTAVPSPFARFDLVQTAFKNINNNPLLVADKGDNNRNIEASKFDEQIVSHTLDLAEYIFDSYARGVGAQFDILTWYRSKQGGSSHLDALRESTTVAHKDFADALELYLNQDAEEYNFGQMNKIFLFKYNGKVIGSTSPVTFFCPSAANLSTLGIRRIADRRLVFGPDCLPLYKRTIEFQKWFYELLAVCANCSPQIKTKLTCIYDYADKSIAQSGSNQTEFSNILGGTIRTFSPQYSPLYDKKGSNSPVDILGVALSIGSKDSIGKSLLESDFLIKSTKKNLDGTPLPLVLQDGFGKPDWNYFRGLSFQSINVPSYEEKPWMEKRVLPGFSDIEGHYLTVSDFLQPYLIRTIYPISSRFYDGGCKSDKENQGYLLPLKRDFFRFFTIKDLTDGGQDKPKLSINPKNDGDVEVTLSIPVKKGDIIFKRTYKKSNQNQKLNLNDPNGGVILDAKFGTTIFPFIKASEWIKKDETGPEEFVVHAKINYRIQLVDADKTPQLLNRDYLLEFYTQDGVNVSDGGIKNKHRRFDKRYTDTNTGDKKYTSSTDYYMVKKDFDIIQLKVSDLKDAEALIIPNWPLYNGGASQFTFAVDFGTTNTYIAYKTDRQAEEAFYLNNAIATLFDENHSETETKISSEGAKEIMSSIDREFVPRRIGKKDRQDGNIFIFPQRTAIAYSQEMTDDDWTSGNGLDTLLEGNIPFGYEKTSQFGNEIATNLKWGGNNQRTELQVSAYLEEIVMLMQAKVLLSGGNLRSTRVIWFYPSSMGTGQIGRLTRTWNDYMSEYFFDGEPVPNGHVISVPESLAPFYAEKDNNAFHSGAVASIDIGGGTTDIAVFGDVEGRTTLKATTSFKFAGNALFGDGYSERAADKNGFVIRFAGEFAKKLEGYPVPLSILKELWDEEKEVLRTKKASDINTFLFSIENAISFWAKGKELTRREKTDFSYTEQLGQCDDLKFLVLYFYVAIVYHLSKVLKKIGEPVQYLMFSGTASKMLKILDCSSEVSNLTMFTKKVFDELGLESRNLNVLLVDKPKEITCNGGLKAKTEELVTANTDIKNATPLIYTCIKDKEFESLNYSDYRNGLDSIIEELIEFHKFFFKLNNDRNFKFSEFWIINEDVTQYVQDNYENLIKKWTKDSIIRNQPVDAKNQPIDEKVSETPFFMPLKSIILALSEEIAKKWGKQNN